MTILPRISALIVAFGVGGWLNGEDALLPGHSHQGEAFNAGPRQFAHLGQGFGQVDFAVTCSWPPGQEFFLQGIGQLHGFLYFEAERTFRHIAAQDPDCAMAYWGMAMANWENEKRAKEFMAKAMDRSDGVTAREKMYLVAQSNYLLGEEKDQKKRKRDLIRDLEAIIRAHPDDLEARAFLSCRIWQFSSKGIEIGSHQAVESLMAPIFEQNPMHPAHHYRIHLWDQENPALALDSAAILGATAPAIAHMWHMPGHIYSRLHRYDDAVWAQEASARVDHRTMAEQRILPDQIHNYAHNNEWMVRNLIFLGDQNKALAVAQSLLANPRHPVLNHRAKANSSVGHGRNRLREVFVAFQMWEELLQASTGDLSWLDAASQDADWIELQLARALAQFFLNRVQEFAQTKLQVAEELQGHEEKIEAARAKTRSDAEGAGKSKKDIEQAIAAAVKPLQRRRKELQDAGARLEVLAQIMRGEMDQAKEGLTHWDKYFSPVKAEIARRIGDAELAFEFVKNPPPDQTLPHLAKVEALLALGREMDAEAAFRELQKIAFVADLSAMPFQRLTQRAKVLGWTAGDDWRSPPPERSDIGSRPALGTLGPIAWVPPQAPDFTLLDENLKAHSLSEWRGRPLILIFYLGHGCLHCIEQLNLFAPLTAQFREAGFDLVAVSTDTLRGLQKSQEKSLSDDMERFPFLLLSNPDLGTFRAFRAFDDFENSAMHGTYVIDAAGQILWSDIGPEPFSDPQFLLQEARRLVKLYAR